MDRALKVGMVLLLTLAMACDDTGNQDPGPGTPDPGPADIGGEEDAPEPAEDTAPDTPEPEADAQMGDVPEEDIGPELIPGTVFIEPADFVLDQAPGAREDITFQLFEVDDDGEAVPLDGAQWSSAEPQAGQMDGFTGTFTTLGLGAQTTITATRGPRSAQTTLTVRLAGTLFAPDASPADAEAFDAPPFDAPPDQAPRLLYPEDGVMLPSNIRGVTIQWEGAGLSLFKVRFKSDLIDLSVITRESVFLPSDDVWRAVVQSSIGGSVEVTVEGADVGEVVRGGASVTMRFAPDAVFGAVYYWSTGDAGIMRLPVGDLEAERFFTPASPVGSPCVGCHAVSRDGSRIAFNTAPVGIPIGPLMQISAEDPTERIIDLDQNIEGMQPTFNPDGTRIVSGWNGTLTERDANGRCDDMTFCTTDADCMVGACTTGIPIRTIPRPPGVQMAFPDWSPDDRWLVSAGTRGGILVDFEISNAMLVLTPNFGGEWGTPLTLFEPRDENESSHHPSFSPDSQWIAFNHLGGTSLDPNANFQNSDLWLTSPTIRRPIELTKAGGRPEYINSWPKWAPTSGRYLWLTFSSSRDYGKVPRDAANPQIWITAIDPSKAAVGQDPSLPAFWLPGQSIDSGNHIPYWAPYQKAPEPEEGDNP